MNGRRLCTRTGWIAVCVLALGAAATLNASPDADRTDGTAASAADPIVRAHNAPATAHPADRAHGTPADVHLTDRAHGTPANAHLVDPLGVAWLTGEWEGEGWMQLGPDRVETFHQQEVVRPALGGGALILEGTAFAMADGRIIEGMAPVHQALAVLTRDGPGGGVSFRAWRVEGEGILAVDATAEIEDQVLIWGFHDPAFGHLRYRITETAAGEWHETGRISPDGEQWFDFFEMTLRRVEG